MHYILITRELSEKEIQKIHALAGVGNMVIIAKPEFSGIFAGTWEYISLTKEEKKRINGDVFSRILEFGDRVIDGKCISQHLNFHGAGLWYYQKFRIFFNIRNRQYNIEELKKNLKGAKTATLFTADFAVSKTELDLDEVELIPLSMEKKDKISYWAIIQYAFTEVLRFLISIFSGVTALKKKQILCIDTVGQYRKILNLDGSSVIFENVFLGYLFQKKREQIGFIDQLLIPKFFGVDKYRFSSKHLKNHNKRSRILGERIIMRGLFSAKVIGDFNKTRLELVKKYKLLDHHLANDSMHRQILQEFIKLNSTSLFYLFKYFSYYRFFRRNRFSTVMSVDENSANFKIILDAAKQHGIFSVGYQHGGISQFSPAYMYSKKDMRQKPIPDLTITWGKKWVDILTDYGNYPNDRLEIPGQVRTDIIENLKNNNAINRESVFDGVKQKYIVLFATQPQKDPHLRYKAAEDAILACQQVESVHLVFKLHPRENDPEFYLDIAKKHKMSNFSIEKDRELYVLLKISDLVITCFSTVGTEALYFNKPLIILDHLKEDIVNYYKDGVAFQATNEEELKFYIQEILKGNLAIDKKVLENYIRESTYKIDGMVSERVWGMLISR